MQKDIAVLFVSTSRVSVRGCVNRLFLPHTLQQLSFTCRGSISRPGDAAYSLPRISALRHFIFFILLLVSTSLLAQSTLKSIPNQKLINGSYVSNPDRILDDATVRELDNLLTSLEKQTTAQVAVVVVESIGDVDIFEFAQKLFDNWGIGNKDNDNGWLVLFVNDKRTVRFHTGYGLEGALPDVVCKRIQRDFMVPEFKNGNYNAGMLAGLQQVEKVLTDPTYAEELKASEGNEVSDFTGLIIFLSIIFGPVLLILFIIKAINGRFSDSKTPEYTAYPEMLKSRKAWLIEFVVLPILIVALFGISPFGNATGFCVIALYLYFMATLFLRLQRIQTVINRFLAAEDYHDVVEFIRKQQWYWFFMAVLFPLPFVFYFFYHLSRKKHYRNLPRKCKQCQGVMHKKSEIDEDEYLSEGMQMEETLRAVDYDVWKCEACAAIEVFFFLNSHSKYESCPKCKTIAYHSTSKRTLKSATYSSSGKGEEVHVCKFCGHTKTSPYRIAKLTSSSSSSSSGGGSGGSSSGGGSWGGGSSGGGGASSSW